MEVGLNFINEDNSRHFEFKASAGPLFHTDDNINNDIQNRCISTGKAVKIKGFLTCFTNRKLKGIFIKVQL